MNKQQLRYSSRYLARFFFVCVPGNDTHTHVSILHISFLRRLLFSDCCNRTSRQRGHAIFLVHQLSVVSRSFLRACTRTCVHTHTHTHARARMYAKLQTCSMRNALTRRTYLLAKSYSSLSLCTFFFSSLLRFKSVIKTLYFAELLFEQDFHSGTCRNVTDFV